MANRAVALARVHGPTEALRALVVLPTRAALEKYYLLHAVEGELWLDAGEPAKAAVSLRRALSLATLEAERVLLTRRLAEAEARG